MAGVVWKKELKPGEHTYSFPVPSTLLHVALQKGVAQVWFLCDPAEKVMKDRVLLLTGTGHEFDEHPRYRFIGTMLTEDQNFVFHVFERMGLQGWN